jgi:hypothetical protein
MLNSIQRALKRAKTSFEKTVDELIDTAIEEVDARFQFSLFVLTEGTVPVTSGQALASVETVYGALEQLGTMRGVDKWILEFC